MSVARSYAKALYEAAQEAKTSPAQLDQFESDLESLVKVLEQSKEMKVALLSPATGAKEKVAVVEELAKKANFPKLLSNFLSLLARKERLTLLPEIRDAFSTVRLEADGGIQGQVVSADPLEANDVETLSRAFSQKFGKKVAFRTFTDPALLAGMKVTVNGVTYDGSLRSQLQKLRERIVFGTRTAH